MRRRTYVAMVGSASLAGCLGRLGETERQTDSVDFQKLWETGLEDDDGPIWAFRATADGETAYLGTKSELTALSLEDGTEQWALPLDTFLGGVTIDDDGLFILYSNTMQRIDPDTGESRWTTTADKSTGYSLVVTTDEHVAVSGAGAVFVFEKESGQQTAQPTEANGNSVRAWDGQFVVAEDSAVTAYDPDGTAQWTVDDVSLNWLTPVVGSTVVGGGNGTFVGIDLEGGTQAWTTEVSGRLPHAKTAATDDTVFVYPWGPPAPRTRSTRSAPTLGRCDGRGVTPIATPSRRSCWSRASSSMAQTAHRPMSTKPDGRSNRLTREGAGAGPPGRAGPSSCTVRGPSPTGSEGGRHSPSRLGSSTVASAASRQVCSGAQSSRPSAFAVERADCSPSSSQRAGISPQNSSTRSAVGRPT